MKSIIITFCFVALNYIIINAQCTSGDCDNGYGVYKFDNGSKYEGNWNDGKFHGEGKYYFSDGSIYEGQFLDGKFHGEGKYFIHDGDIYSGNYINDTLKGDGSIFFSDGSKYIGKIYGYKMEGNGKYIHSSGWIYQGNFKNNLFDGFGELVFHNGQKYVGNFLEDKYHGKGELTYSDGDKYIGDFINGELNGNVLINYKDGTQYNGEFKNNAKNGHGIQIYSNGTKIEGNWKENQLEIPPPQNNSTKLTSIPLIPKPDGTYEIMVNINDALKTFLIMDTGASESTISADICLTLIRSKSIDGIDYLDDKEYMTASGNVIKSRRLKLKSIHIGNYYLQDIVVSISDNLKAPLLLGQNALSKLGRITLDYKNHTLTVGE